MATEHLFPCSCGKKIPITTTQAGRRIECDCGKSHQLPSMQEIRALEKRPESDPAEGQSATQKNSPTARTVVLFTGMGVLLVGIVLSVVAAYSYPEPKDILQQRTEFWYYGTSVSQNHKPLPQSEHRLLWLDQEDLDDLSPLDSTILWNDLNRGPSMSYSFQDRYYATKEGFRFRLLIAGLITGLGILLVIISRLLPRRQVQVGALSGQKWE